MHVGIASGFANHSNVPDRQFIREEMTQLLLAAELGFESIWMTEHHFSEYSISPNPLQYLTWLAAKTKVRLGTQVVVVPWRDPVRLAEEIAVLDHVSDGRAIIGFGRGLSRKEYTGLLEDLAALDVAGLEGVDHHRHDLVEQLARHVLVDAQARVLLA